MQTRALAHAAVAALVAVACRSASDPVPPTMPHDGSQQAPQRPQAPRATDSEGDEAPLSGSHYVAPDGDDGADGTARAPWRTLERAASEVGPGDTVVVRAGRYRGFWLETSGTADEPIRFVAEEGAIITDPEHRDGINLEGASHIELRGFRVRGAPRAGIRAVECDGVVIRDNVLDESGKWGILTSFCDDVKIVGNEASRTREQHGVYVSSTCERPVVRGNHLWGNGRAGLHMNGDRHIGGAGVIEGARIVGNVIHDNGRDGAAGINLDGVQRSLIANNLLYGNEATGIAIYQIDGGEPSRDNAIVHNTVVMPESSSRWGLLLQHGATGTTLYNNIIVHESARRGAIMATRDSLEDLESDANLVTERLSVDNGDTIVDLDAWRRLTDGDADSGAAPAMAKLFVDPRSGDFRPADDSPARGAAAPLPSGIRGRLAELAGSDLEGAARPAGGARDLGCYQVSRADAGT